MKIKISYKSLIQKFHPCTPDFIKNVCHGNCCLTDNGLKNCHIAIVSSDFRKLEKYNIKIKNGLLQTDKRCIFQDNDGLCKIHETNDYPTFSCRIPPLTLNKNNILIVENRWRNFKCFRVKEGKIPVYFSHRKSLEAIFGEEKTKFIINWLETKKTDLEIDIDDEIYQEMMKKTEILYQNLFNKNFIYKH